MARVDSVKPHPNSDKLIICQLDCGDHTRQIVAGLQQYVDVGSFEGAKVVCIINLKTAKLGGETSEGMILASSSDSKVTSADAVVRGLFGEAAQQIRPVNSGNIRANLCILSAPAR